MGPRRVLALMFGFALLSLMCALPFPTSPPTPSGDMLATRVAATLTAMAPESGTGSPDVPSTPGPAMVTSVPSSPVPPTTAVPEVRLRLVYTDGGFIMALDDGGGPRRLGRADRVQRVYLTQDGTRVVFLREVDAQRQEIWVINSDGTGERRLLSADDMDALHPRDPGTHLAPYQVVVVPGTHGVLFNTWVLHEGPGLIVSRDLFYLDVDSGALTRLLDRGEAGHRFALSPDGRVLALLHPDAIDMARLEGTALRDVRRRVLTFTPVNTYSEYAFIPEVTWQTGAEALGVVIPPPDIMDPAPPPLRFWRVTPEGATRLGELPGEGGCLSPDLQWAVVYRGESQLLARSDGSAARVYPEGGCFWSPDSRYFAGFSSEGPRMLSVGRVDGSPAITFPLGDEAGTGFHWLSEDTFYLWVGRRGAWRLVRGSLGGTWETLVSSASDFPSYDILP